MAVALCGYFRDMTRRGTNVQNRSSNRHDVINLARMKDAGKIIGNHEDVEMRRRERPRYFIQRLIRQTLHIAEPVSLPKLFNFCLFAPAAYKAEHKAVVEMASGLE